MTTRQYFFVSFAAPAALCFLGLVFGPPAFAPVFVAGGSVYTLLAIVAWWRTRHAARLGAFGEVGAIFPFASALLLGGVFSFPEIVGGSNGESITAMVGMFAALIVGYSYVLIVWLGYLFFRKVRLVVNEFAA